MRSRKFVLIVALALVAALCTSSASADESNDNNQVIALIKSLKFRSGDISLEAGKVHLNLGDGYRYLDPGDTEILLTKVYKNPPSAVQGAIGLIVPTSVNPFSSQGWFAVLSYSDDGHVSDEDASSIDYGKLLNTIKKNAEAASTERRKSGYEGYKVIGWAQRPFYNSKEKKLYWAKAVKFDSESTTSLNYDVRILGRQGYVNVKIVASMGQLAEINQAIPHLLPVINFAPGSRYSDYVASTDRTAAYGIAGLIAGGVLAKAGFFKALLAIIAASGKAIIAVVLGAFAAVGAFFKKLFGRPAGK